MALSLDGFQESGYRGMVTINERATSLQLLWQKLLHSN